MNHYYENQLETRLYYTNVLTFEKKTHYTLRSVVRNYGF